MSSSQFFFLSLADIFSVYPTIFKELLQYEDEKRKLKGGRLQKDYIYLPSDAKWQDKVYFRLLDVQKQINIAIENKLEIDDNKAVKQLWDPLHILDHVSPISTSPTPGRSSPLKNRCIQDHAIEYIDINLLGSWNLEHIANAGKLLRKPPIPVRFDDEHEMRKVYSLIYDVFRYKHVLSQALNDVSFYGRYPTLKPHEPRVWLLLFELYSRHFIKRNNEDYALERKLYKEAELDYISNCLWDLKIRLAAAISRLRIKSKALHLSHLLPPHLQNEKVAIAAANPIVTGWMNPFKMKDKELAIEWLHEMGLTEVNQEGSANEKPLQPNQYKWDKICPLFMSCLPNDRGEFAKSELVRNNIFVMQDRTFSIAPAILSRLLDHFQIDGDIVQTHVSSPRSTAYLAALFYSVNRVNDFIAFGAGHSLEEYQEYIESLGINNLRLFSENFCSLPLESPVLEAVVGVFATPPNSFSGIADPIDLICSRGGDLSMLEVLTESEISKDGRRRVAQILEEQRETLRLSMSRPQVQFVLYETHSIVGTENQDMVEKSVEIINRCAFEKHIEAYKEKKRLEALAEAELANIPAAAFGSSSPRKRTTAGGAASSAGGTKDTKETKDTSASGIRDSKVRMGGKLSRTNSESDIGIDAVCSGEIDDYSSVISMPKTDEFLITDVPDVCLNQDSCMDFSSLGCYVSLIQRKEVTRLDAKYLIKMAEGRGLFGSADRKKSGKPRTAKKSDKAQDRKAGDADKNKLSKGDIDTLICRLNQPTHSSFIRSNLQRISMLERQPFPFNSLNRQCGRHTKHHTLEYPCVSTTHLDSRAKKWWDETTKYIKLLRNIQKRKSDTSNGNISRDIKKLVKGTTLPPLALPRLTKRQEYNSKTRQLEKVPFPVTVIHLELDSIVKKPNRKHSFLYNAFYHSENYRTSAPVSSRSMIDRKSYGSIRHLNDFEKI